MKITNKIILKLVGVVCMVTLFMGCQASEKSETLKLERTEHPSVMKESIRHLSIVKEGETTFEVMYDPKEYKNSADYWEILIPYKSTVVVDTEVMYELYDTVSEIDFSQAVEVGERVDTGIDDGTDCIYVEYYAQQEEGKAGQAEATASYLLKIGNEDGRGNRYAALEGFEDQVYLVSDETLENIFNVNPYSMVLKVVNLVDSATVSKIDVSFGDEKHSLTKDDGKYEYDKEKIEESKFLEYYTSLFSVFIQKEIPEGVNLEKNREKIGEIVYHRTTDEAKTTTTTFYAYDDEYCTVNVDGEEFFMVSKDEVQELLGKFQ